MGRLRDETTGEEISLGARVLLGRGATCHLRVDDRAVSHEHAVLTHRKDQWTVRDLGSANGTFVDGVRLNPGDESQLARGARLEVAGRALVLIDDGPPCPAARASDGRWVSALDGLIALPDDDTATVTLEETPSGWSHDGELLDDGAKLEVDGETWSLVLPRGERTRERTTAVAQEAPWPLEDLGLRFVVSPDEEHIEVFLVHRGQSRALPPRACHELLLYLARARHEDEAAQLPEREHGYRYADEVATHLARSAQQLNLDVFRARKLVMAANVEGADRIVERRATTRQLRLGAAVLEIVAGS